MWRKRSSSNFRYCSGIFLEGLKRTTENRIQGSRFTGWNLNPGSPEKEAGVLPTRCDVRFEMVSNQPSRNLSNQRSSQSQGSATNMYIRQQPKFHKSSENTLEKNDCIEVLQTDERTVTLAKLARETKELALTINPCLLRVNNDKWTSLDERDKSWVREMAGCNVDLASMLLLNLTSLSHREGSYGVDWKHDYRW